MSRKVINVIISSSNNIYFVKKNEIKNIELKEIEGSRNFIVPIIRNADYDTSILRVNFQTNNSDAGVIIYFELLLIGPTRTVAFSLNGTKVEGPTINSGGIYKIAIDSDFPLITKLD